MAEGVKHDYHLVNPSPWPLVGSIAATVMALGGVAWMKGLFGLPAHTSWLFFAGLAGVLFTMIAWWRDVVNEANAGDHTPVVSIGLRYGMILFIASEVLFFAAFFWAFFDASLFPNSPEMPVLYFVDPKYAEDPDTKGKGQVTLSYTFYPAVDAKPATTTAKASAAKPASGLGGPAAAGL